MEKLQEEWWVLVSHHHTHNNIQSHVRVMVRCRHCQCYNHVHIQVAIRSTPFGRYFWQLVQKCHVLNLAHVTSHPQQSYDSTRYTETYCIQQLAEAMKGYANFTRVVWNQEQFPDGRMFFG